MGKLTEGRIRKARPGRGVLWLGDGEGLWLRVRPRQSNPEGSKTFILREQRNGAVTVETLGQWPAMTLAEAREAAWLRRRMKSKPSAMPVGDAVKLFLEARIVPRYRRPWQMEGRLTRGLASIAARPLGKVEKADLTHILQEKTRDGPVAANRLMESMKGFFGYCVKRGWLHESPARDLDRTVAGGAESQRTRVLTDEEIRQIWTFPAPHGPLLRFLLFTGARIGEAQHATWSEIERDLWRIPAEHSKNARAHIVHLSSQAREVLDALHRRGELVFGFTSDTAVQAWLKRWCEREKIEPRFTPHDLRRTFSTRMNAIGIAPHVVEKCLNHTMEGVMRTYNLHEYLEERRAAFDALGREIERILSST